MEDIKYVCFYNGLVFEMNIDYFKWVVVDNDLWMCIGDLNRDV